MRSVVLLTICASVLLGGCQTHQFTRRNTNKHSSTLADFLYIQTLENVARFEYNPDSMPSFSTIGDGTAQAVDTGSLLNPLSWTPAGTTAGLSTTLTRSLQDNWKLQPVMSAGRLHRLRCALQIVVRGVNTSIFELPACDSACSDKDVCRLAKFEFDHNTCRSCIMEMIKMDLLPAPDSAGLDGEYVEGSFLFCSVEKAQKYAEKFNAALECNFPRQWYCLEQRRAWSQSDCCTHSGVYCENVAWVDSAGVDELSRYTVTLLTLALNDPPPRQSITVKKTFVFEGDEYELTGTRDGSIDAFDPTPDPNMNINELLTQIDDLIADQNATNKAIAGNRVQAMSDHATGIIEKLEKQGVVTVNRTNDLQALHKAIVNQSQCVAGSTELSGAQKAFALKCVYKTGVSKLSGILNKHTDDDPTPSSEYKKSRRSVNEKFRSLELTPKSISPLDLPGSAPLSNGRGGIEYGGSGTP